VLDIISDTLFTVPKLCLLLIPVDNGKDQAVDDISCGNKGRLDQHILVVIIIFPSNKKIK
jgi:hypothetical protein